MTDKSRIILVEDDPEIQDLLRDYLIEQNFDVKVVGTASGLDNLLKDQKLPDLIILDVMLPGEDGLSICRRLRASSDVPVIMLTAKGEEVDRIIGLEMGADDYIAKPFSPRELLARIKAILRRSVQNDHLNVRMFEVGEYTINLDTRSIETNLGEPVSLTSAEFDLLECFITRPGRVLSRDQLMDWTRGRRAEALDRTIDVQVSRLRKKIETKSEPMIKTLRNAGYLFCEKVKPIRK